MTRRTRLSLIALVLIVSASYGLLVSRDPDFARTIMLGYIGVVLTIFVVSEVWKKP